ncbi:hypothetical protein Ancab_005659 [Ancistrocladus abbreviatus]
MAFCLKVSIVQHSSSHLELPTYPPLKMPIDSISPTSHYPIANPMLLEDLGISITLTSTLCAPISSVPIMMTRLALPEGMGLKFYQGSHQNILAPLDGLQDEHPVTQILEIWKNKVDGQIPLDQIISQPEDSGKKS